MFVSFAELYNNFLNSIFVPLQGLREATLIHLFHEKRQPEFWGLREGRGGGGAGTVGRDECTVAICDNCCRKL